MSREEDVRKLRDQALSSSEQIDVWVNNAGVRIGASPRRCRRFDWFPTVFGGMACLCEGERQDKAGTALRPLDIPSMSGLAP